jgi:hypothetical protein
MGVSPFLPQVRPAQHLNRIVDNGTFRKMVLVLARVIGIGVETADIGMSLLSAITSKGHMRFMLPPVGFLREGSDRIGAPRQRWYRQRLE